MSATGPRPSKVVLTEALSELRERESKLARLGTELVEVRAAIKALQRLVGSGARPSAERSPREQPVRDGRRPDADNHAVVLAIIADAEPCSAGLLQERSGRTSGSLYPILNRLLEARQIQKVGAGTGARYWTTVGLDRHAAQTGGAPPPLERAA